MGETDRVRTLHKALAFVIRDGDVARELLVFAHPEAGVQIPKGTVERGEHPEEAVLRELFEESGVSDVRIAHRFDPIVREPATSGSAAFAKPAPGVSPEPNPHVPPGGSRHVWHIFELNPSLPLPDTWTHAAYGSAEESGLDFAYFWVELDGAHAVLHPVFHPALALVTQRSC